MTSTKYHDDIAYSRLHFEEGLIRAGFIQDKAGWQGNITYSARTIEVRIVVPHRFPFKPPCVTPVDPNAVAWSWHRNLDGSLCLVADDDHEELWWAEASVFLEHVIAWFEQSAANWPDDRPDLDLDRYFVPSKDRRLYIYSDLCQHTSEFVRFEPSRNNTMRCRRSPKPVRAQKHGKYQYGYVVNIGEVNTPPRTWDDIINRIKPSFDLERMIRTRSIKVLALVYRRNSQQAVIWLEVYPTLDGHIVVKRLRSGADTSAARAARSGVIAPQLHSCKVAIIGVGALGSFIADMLIRSGIRHLTLIDEDIVMPGNIVRHLVDPTAVGLSKVSAVKRHLVEHAGDSDIEIIVRNDPLALGDEAFELLENHDLVVDATADFATTALLHISAESLTKHFISATIQNGGTSYRIDLLPPLDGTDPLPQSSFNIVQRTPELFEAGCGSPISPTPPYVVIEAAAATVRHAIALLVEQPLHPAGEVRHLSITGTESYTT